MMTIKEASRLSVMHQIDKKMLSIRKASEELGLSYRHTRRLRKRYEAKGKKGLISKRRGHFSPNRISQDVRNQVVELLKDPLSKGWGPTFAKEKLETLHGLHVSRETMRSWMIEEGLWKSKRKKERRIYQRRTRRSRFGDMIQGDGSHHDWFEGKSEKCALLLFVDDATSQITSARFFPTETTDGYLEVLENHLKSYGRPCTLYVDKHSVFRVNNQEIKKGEGETHFAKVLKELDIELICAHSPQAKGRVERANGTLQDRLVKEMRLRGISNIEEGNSYLQEFIEGYNRQFGKIATEQEDAHRPLRCQDELERIFARKESRKLSKDLSFQYKKTLYQIQTKSPNRIRKMHAQIIEKRGRPILVEIDGKAYDYKKWKDVADTRPKIIDAKELELSWQKRPQTKPRKHHPWR